MRAFHLLELENFGIKASTVRQFLTSSGLPSKKSERTEEKSTERLAEIALNQALVAGNAYGLEFIIGRIFGINKGQYSGDK
tara:strand:- start:1285 stop:1527 length:243 start_codon:yes stop_codon:yes gene_type:complete